MPLGRPIDIIDVQEGTPWAFAAWRCRLDPRRSSVDADSARQGGRIAAARLGRDDHAHGNRLGRVTVRNSWATLGGSRSGDQEKEH
jgi:hypothetical protein